MPDLPTINVTQGQYDRLLEVFEGTASEKTEAYRNLVKNSLRQHVIDSKIRSIRETESLAAEEAIGLELSNPDNI